MSNLSFYIVRNKLRRIGEILTLLGGVISSFCHRANEIFALLGCYALLVGSQSPIFWNDLSVPSSRVKSPRRVLLDCWSHEDGLPETLITS